MICFKLAATEIIKLIVPSRVIYRYLIREEANATRRNQKVRELVLNSYLVYLFLLVYTLHIKNVLILLNRIATVWKINNF